MAQIYPDPSTGCGHSSQALPSPESTPAPVASSLVALASAMSAYTPSAFASFAVTASSWLPEPRIANVAPSLSTALARRYAVTRRGVMASARR